MVVNKSIKGFILTAAFLVSTVLFLTMYLAASSVFTAAVGENATTLADRLAQGTFNAMYQIMRRGWTRPQLEEFIQAVEQSEEAQGYRVAIYRGEPVTRLFGPIEQPPIAGLVAEVLASGESGHQRSDDTLVFAYPLNARSECLRCHVNASEGNTLGVIEVRQELGPLLTDTKGQLLTQLLLIAPLPFLVAIGVALYLNRRINRSISVLQQSIDTVNRVSDLTHIELEGARLGFAELDSIFAKVQELTSKLKGVAVDKELLEFEIRLLEKFVITSEVVRDWREYVASLLTEINKVIRAYTLFSIFKVDDELFDLEIFWKGPPEANTLLLMERVVRRSLKGNPNFDELTSISINHNVADPEGERVSLDEHDIELQTKSLFVDTPKIGGIVGIGVHSTLVRDETRILVMESILSTLLNVVGSVKAIYKYTRDLEYYATRDPLTNLYNQRIFWELLGYEVDRAQRHDYPFGVLVIDLDNFKTINDTYGHAFGDRFLQQLANRAYNSLRAGDILARYGGDEFVAILPETTPEEARQAAGRVLTQIQELALEAPDGAVVKGTASIGISIYPDHATDAKDLFLFADNMMYKAKQDGRNRIGFPTKDEVVEIFRSIGEKSLLIVNAIEQRLVVPYFQPILDVVSGEIAAVEVLSRIHLPDNTVIGAHEFIEIAEKSGLIHKTDYIAMDKAFATFKAAGYRGRIFLNLSPRALVLNEFIPEVRRLIQLHGIEPAQIVFEITERDTVKNFAVLEKFINDLKLEGFALAIDDFGSGFSSFHYLKRFPVDYVKIEGDFIVNMAADGKDRAFVHSIAKLARELGIKTVAEFVENEEVLMQVEAVGLDYAQGFHIGRPSQQLMLEPTHLALPVKT